MSNDRYCPCHLCQMAAKKMAVLSEAGESPKAAVLPKAERDAKLAKTHGAHCPCDVCMTGYKPKGDEGNPKIRTGIRKPPIHLVPPVAIIMEAMAFKHGEDVHGPANWREYPVSASTYYSAAARHFMQWWDGEDVDQKSGVAHLAAARANLGILLDAAASGTLIDDRPKPGGATATIEKLTQRVTPRSEPE